MTRPHSHPVPHPSMKAAWALLILAGVFFPTLRAQEKPLSGSARISLITAAPGEDIYAHYGHTAVRVNDPANGFDLVFNYGIFDFNSPHFLYRFVRGETDYICAAYAYSDFLLEYQMEGRSVDEQVLNLDSASRERIWQALVDNIQPENRTYRYNFFFNNCATKPRDLIVAGLDGTVDYRWTGPFRTLRDALHRYTAAHPWTQFGIDFVIGAEADRPAPLAHQQFAPDVLEQSVARAVVVDDEGTIRPLVAETGHPVRIPARNLTKGSTLTSPHVVTWTLLLLILGISVAEIVLKRRWTGITLGAYILFGLTGSLMAFLAVFSTHPATHENYLLLWQHPFHLVFAVGMIFGTFRRKIMRPYLWVNFGLQALALAGLLFLPQRLHPAMIPLLLLLILRTAVELRPTIDHRS